MSRPELAAQPLVCTGQNCSLCKFLQILDGECLLTDLLLVFSHCEFFYHQLVAVRPAIFRLPYISPSSFGFRVKTGTSSERKAEQNYLWKSLLCSSWPRRRPVTCALFHHSGIKAFSGWLFVAVFKRLLCSKRASWYFGALHGQVNHHAVDFLILIWMTLLLG